ncbi:MAG: hypothetical protein VXW32_03265 [Myxococcota bacterium]|nr:hypothetical protein [Myxococcota bacterium]
MSAQFDPTPHFTLKSPPEKLLKAAKIAVAVGVLCFVAGLLIDGYGKRIRVAYLTNLVYFIGLSLGGLIFACTLTLTLARWGRGLKRIGESFLMFMPVALVLLAIFILTGGLELYEWYTHPETLHAHKAIYLTTPFWVARLFIGLGLLTFVAFRYLRISLRPDLGVASKQLNGKHPAWWNKYTKGWTNEAEEVEKSAAKQRQVAPVVCILFACVLTVSIVDLVMSLSPHWYSNMFGGWYFASCFWLAMIWVGIYSVLNRGWMGTEKLFKPVVYHDLGKLVFGFCVVWAYMFYAQLLPIWYGNMTEEIGFLIVRLRLDPWQDLAVVVAMMCFVIPFVTLLSRGIKKMPMVLTAVFMIPAVGIWLERYIVAAPSTLLDVTAIPIGILELGVTAGFVGGFLWVVTNFLSQVPVVPVSDPLMNPHPDDVHVHSMDAHAH